MSLRKATPGQIQAVDIKAHMLAKYQDQELPMEDRRTRAQEYLEGYWLWWELAPQQREAFLSMYWPV